MVFIDKAQGCVFVWSGLRISKTCITLTWLLLVSGEHIYVTVSVNRLNFTHPETNIIFKINEYKSIYHLFLFSSPEEKTTLFLSTRPFPSSKNLSLSVPG